MIIENKTKRMNISLPLKTIELIDQTWPLKGFKSRSSFLDEAARQYAIRLQKASLKRKLKAGYLTRAKRDAGLTKEWNVASSELLTD